LAVEQAFVTLSDLCHFLEHQSPHLKQLSTGPLAQKTMRLILQMETFAAVATIRIFKKASVFLKELSDDNVDAKGLQSAELN
jgi:hypothetical protein